MTDDRPVTTFRILSEREYQMTRVFAAPRDLVYQAYTDPAHIPHWWGPREVTTVVDVMDVRPGGAWRFIQHHADGSQFAFRGDVLGRDLEPPDAATAPGAAVRGWSLPGVLATPSRCGRR